MSGFLSPLLILGLSAAVSSPAVPAGGEIRGSVSTRSAISAGPASAQSALTSSVRLSRGGRPNGRVPLPRVTVSGTEFRRLGSRFNVWGFHGGVVYDFMNRPDRPAVSRTQIEECFNGFREMGANVSRMFIQMFDFIEGPDKDNLTFNYNPQKLDDFLFILDTARKNSIYIKPCCANVFFPDDAPAWYDALHFYDRWDVQEFFITGLVTGIVQAGHASTIFGYDLTSEPSVKSDPNHPWYVGPSYPPEPEYFNSVIARGPDASSTSAQEWITQLSNAIKAVDPEALVTVGTLGYVGGAFGRDNTQAFLDFVSPHIYPTTQHPPDALAQVAGWALSTVPIMEGEIFFWGLEADNRDLAEAVSQSFSGAISWSQAGWEPDEYVFPEFGTGDFWHLVLEQYSLGLFIEYRDSILNGSS
jgi:hypothetical protein